MRSPPLQGTERVGVGERGACRILEMMSEAKRWLLLRQPQLEAVLSASKGRGGRRDRFHRERGDFLAHAVDAAVDRADLVPGADDAFQSQLLHVPHGGGA